jgi:hypothetical protein
MTVPTAQHSVIAQGTGATFTFGYPTLDIYSNDELLVYHIDDNVTPAVLTLLAEGTGATEYAITNNTPYSEGKSDGFITYPADSSTAIPAGEWILMIRQPVQKQENTFRNLGIQLPKNIETAMDKLQHQVLFLQEQLDRALLVDRAVNPSTIELTGEDVASLEANATAAAASAAAAAASATAAQATVDNAFLLDVETDATAARTLALADSTKFIRCTNAAGITVTLPQFSDVGFTVGTVVSFEQNAAGVVSFVAGAGATLLLPSTHNANTNTQYAVAQVKLVAASTWILFGNLAPV